MLAVGQKSLWSWRNRSSKLQTSCKAIFTVGFIKPSVPKVFPNVSFFKKESAGLTTCCECYLLRVTSAMTSLPLWHFEHKHVFLNHLKWKCLNVLENWVLSNLLDAESFNKVLWCIIQTIISPHLDYYVIILIYYLVISRYYFYFKKL